MRREMSGTNGMERCGTISADFSELLRFSGKLSALHVAVGTGPMGGRSLLNPVAAQYNHTRALRRRAGRPVQ